MATKKALVLNTNGNVEQVQSGDKIDGADLSSNSVANAALSNMGNATIKGRTTAGTGAPEDITMAQLDALNGSFALVKTAAQNITNTAGVGDAITGVSWTPDANKTYYARWFIPITTSSTNGLKIAVTFPTGCTAKLMVLGQAASAGGQVDQIITTSATSGATIYTAVVTIGWFSIEGSFINGANATQIDVDVVTLNAGNTVGIPAGAICIVKRVN